MYHPNFDERLLREVQELRAAVEIQKRQGAKHRQAISDKNARIRYLERKLERHKKNV